VEREEKKKTRNTKLTTQAMTSHPVPNWYCVWSYYHGRHVCKYPNVLVELHDIVRFSQSSTKNICSSTSERQFSSWDVVDADFERIDEFHAAGENIADSSKEWCRHRTRITVFDLFLFSPDLN
jgi:hypothetical protein